MKRFITTLFVLSLFLVPAAVFAQETDATTVSATAIAEARLNNPIGADVDVRTLIGRVIGAVLGISGSIALLIFIWGGIQWMFAGGNPEKVKKGQMTLVNAALGLAVLFSAYAIVSLVIGTIQTSTGT